MNEVKATPAAGNFTATAPASSKGQVDMPVFGGKPLPPIPGDEAKTVATPEIARARVNDAVAHMNDFVQSVQRDLHFSVDEDLKRTVVKVVDRTTGELIRQIPDDIFLDLARNLKEEGELHLFNAQG